MLFSMHSLIKIEPGSDFVGVPASEISETISPDLSIFIMFDNFFFSVNLWYEINFDLI